VERATQWRISNLERARSYQREYFALNVELNRAWGAGYRQRHLEQHRARARRDYANHRDARRETQRVYRKNNLDRLLIRNARRIAIRNSASGDLALAEWYQILMDFDHRCAYCQRKLERLAKEHMTPLVRGGEHTVENIVPACTSCNSRKNQKTLLEFAMTN
jgi:5-methylcytosine-specific restriction endonuclease McrA